MAAKKTLMDGYTYQDLFNLQDELDIGGEAKVGTSSWSKGGSFFTHGASGTSDLMANKDNLGSILGQTDAIAAFKKRKLEQQKMAQAGVGTQQSILGGGAF